MWDQTSSQYSRWVLSKTSGEIDQRATCMLMLSRLETGICALVGHLNFFLDNTQASSKNAMQKEMLWTICLLRLLLVFGQLRTSRQF